MNYNETDWDQEPPEDDEVAPAWKDVELSLVTPTSEALLSVEAALASTHVNGWVKVRQFELGYNAVLHWFLSRNRWDEVDLFRQLFSRSEVMSEFAELGAINKRVDQFEMRPAFGALGDLASNITQGGAYTRYSGSDEEVFKLIADFQRDGVGAKTSETTAWCNWEAWADGFCGIAWDGTMIFFAKPTDRITIVAFTDTD